jgi:very-short-patch-repair endonuclease
MVTPTATDKLRESLRLFSKKVWYDDSYYERSLDEEVEPVLAEDADHIFFLAWRALARSYISKACHHLEKLFCKCESPIEELMLFALCIACSEKADSVRYRADGQEFGDLDLGIDAFWIQPQANVGAYRVDFLIEYGAHVRQPEGKREPFEYEWATKGMIVECDGHAFHERTKEQAKRDKLRDRELQKLGYSVFHYTGSEIWTDVFDCANDALTALRKSMGETA